jgi:hypothetical protein
MRDGFGESHCMRRHLFTILSAVSLLLCVMTAVLWVRSYWVADKIQINRPAWREVATYKGRLYLAGSPNSTYSFPMFATDAVTASSRSYDVPDHDLLLLRWGGRGSDGSWARFTRGYSFIGVPLWVVVILTAIFPVVGMRQRYYRDANVGLCAMCGYDLRATPDRCPECGAGTAKLGAKL